jgi:hypothetical protein
MRSWRRHCNALFLLASCGTPAQQERPGSAKLQPSAAPALKRAVSELQSLPPSSVPGVDAQRAGCGDPRGSEYFFPPRALFAAEPASADLLTRTWYSKVLGAMQEPSLSCGSSRNQTFRFVLIPTFQAPAYVRVQLSSRGGVVWSGVLSGAGGYDPGQVMHSTQRALLDAERHDLLQAITRANFWQAPTNEPTDGFDGTQWVLEGRSGAVYHVVQRWMPGAGPFRDLCQKFAGFGSITTQ